VGTRINVPWRPKAEPRVFDDFLREAVPSERDRQVLQDFAGYSLLHWARPFRRALVLTGPKGSGIAPIMEILSWLCGQVSSGRSSEQVSFRQVSSVRPSRLARGHSGTLPPEAWANICYGADPEALAQFPLLSGPMLGGSPAEASSTKSASSGAASDSPNVAKHIYSASGLPPLAAGDPFFQRVLLAACPETLGAEERGPGLRRALWEERGGILQWALEDLRRVLRSAQAGEGFPSGRPAEVTRRRWERLGGPIGRFKDAYLEVTGAPEDVIVKARLYEAYRGFCQREGVLAKLIDSFTPALTDDPLIGSDRRVPEPGADQMRYYIGAKPKRPLDDLIAEARG
jgi:putative DNA primase/helicase